MTDVSDYTESDIPDQVKDQHRAAFEDFKARQDLAATDADLSEAQEVDQTAVEQEAAPKPAQPAHDGEDWQHKYQVLKGKYDAELPRALDEAHYWQDRCTQLQTALEQAKATEPPAAKANDAPVPSDLVDTLGEDAAKAVAQLLKQQREELTNQFGAQLQSTAQLSYQSAADNFWARVRQSLPNYNELRVDPGLNAWLNQAWPGSRQTRLQIAMEAEKALDADAFIGLLQAYQPAATPEVRKAPAPTPRRAAGGGEAPPPERPMSGEEYRQKSQRVIELRQDGRYQQAADLEKELDAAKRSGRVASTAYAEFT